MSPAAADLKRPEARKLLVVDLDGTLLTTGKTITEKNLQAIRDLTGQGHCFAFATGRPVQSALPLAREYGFDRLGSFYIIAYNGALLYDCAANRTIYTRPMARSDVRLIFDEAAKAKIHCHTYDKSHVISERETAMLKEYTRVIKMPPLVVEDAAAFLDVEPLKVICADLYDRSRLEKFEQRIAPLIGNRLESVFSSDMLLEYNAAGADKGNGMLKLCKLLGVRPENTVAAGDQENDLALLRAAGLSCAMANGTEALKRQADYVTENDNDHDGIAEIINGKILK